MVEQEYIDVALDSKKMLEKDAPKNIYNEPILTDVEQNNDGLDVRSFKIAFLILGIVFAILLPKIFLTNSIYHTSKELIFLSNQNDILVEENKRLKQELEGLNYLYF